MLFKVICLWQQLIITRLFLIFLRIEKVSLSETQFKLKDINLSAIHD